MVILDHERTTQCVVHDLTPGSEQKKINIVVRAQSTIEKVFRNISTQYPYEAYDLILQPNETERPLIHLNSHKKELLFSTSGFSPQEKNVIVLLPPDIWDGDVKKRFDFANPAIKKKCISTSPKKETTTTKTKITSKLSPTGRKASKSPTSSNGVDNSADTIKEGTMNGDSADVLPKSGDGVNNNSQDILDKKVALVESSKEVAAQSSPKLARTGRKASKSPTIKKSIDTSTMNGDSADVLPKNGDSVNNDTKDTSDQNEKDASVISSKKVTVKSSSKLSATGRKTSKSPTAKKGADTTADNIKETTVNGDSAEVLPKTGESANNDNKGTLDENKTDASVKSYTEASAQSSNNASVESTKDVSVTSPKKVTVKSSSKLSPTGRKSSKSPIARKGVDTSADTTKEDASVKKSTEAATESSKDVPVTSPKKVTVKSSSKLSPTGRKSSKSPIARKGVDTSADTIKESTINGNSADILPKSGEESVNNDNKDTLDQNRKDVSVKSATAASAQSSNDASEKISKEASEKSSKEVSVKGSKETSIKTSNNNESFKTNNAISNLSGGGDASSTIAEEPAPLHTATATANTVTTTTAATTIQSLKLSPLSDPELLSDDDLALGASASPTEAEPFGGDGLLKIRNTSPRSPKYGPLTEGEMYQQMTLERDFTGLGKKLQPTSASASTTTTAASAATTMSTMSTSTANGYVGLVNQAMTCYLNSLLQALFMTPEFRNALYRWESDNENESKNIPYQLQKLFLNLQTSKKSAVETTDLTRSFGWDSTQAWQQHDIQELCRVMFDALEQKFKNTKQMHLISNLYEGKMIDYVKCLECNTEKTRADTFLDIPLPVRPFGSTVAYGSIEEALRAFVQPETLDGNNQYFCEKCNKKCDAHKGLKFKNFPYILTLHLKRFDFDYQTMHRIKLNDKVTFPQKLNLNSFINPADKEGQLAPSTSTSAAVNATGGPSNTNGFIHNGAVTSNDDCSTTDSGSAMEEDLCCSGTATTASSSQHENDINDDDEGIDMSTSTDHRVTSSNTSVEQRGKHDNGPYLYELFAIMIHSGSASGGHYYAYIKEFDNNEWYCFNDQSVSPITEEDIEKSFGGGSSRAYYSSVYSSSTNAYMLMYRQIDAQRNEKATKLNEFPEHINSLLPKLHQEEETRITRSSGRHGVVVSDLSVQELVKPRVTFYNPDMKKMKSTRVYVSTFNVNSILESAHQMLNVEKFAPLSRCRLVVYDDMGEQICQSLEEISDPSLTELRQQTDGNIEFLLETRAEGQEFEVYKPGGVTWNVYLVNVWKMQLDGPHLVYAPSKEASSALLHSIAKRFNLNEDQLLLATVKTDAFVAQDTAPSSGQLPDGMQQQQVITQEDLQEIAQEQFRGLTHIYLNVPNTDPSTLEILGIPALETPIIEVSSDVVDAVQMNSNAMPTICPPNSSDNAASNISQKNCLSSSSARESPLLSATTIAGQESNSEDSSLSDGDRTLVESINNRYGGDSQISSTSHSPYLSSPEDDAYNKANSLKRIHDLFQMAPDHTVDSASQLRNNNTPQFFYAEKLNAIDPSTISVSSIHSSSTNDANEELARKPTHAYKIIVDPHMKMQTFMRHVESLIAVPSNYFKLQHKYEVIDLTSTVLFVSPGETLSIELGKVLQPDEHKAKISFMRLSELDNDTGKLPCICEWVYKSCMTAGEAKKELIAKLHRIDAQRYKTLTLNNCRIWLKGGRNPIKIMSDDETLGTDLREFLVQECEDGVKPQVGEDSLTIFVRRWYADKLQLDKFQEITLEKHSEIREELAKITDIRQEHIAYSKINGSFPCTSISLLSINTTLSWFSIPATLDKYPLTTTLNGYVYFYKDVTKAPKEPTTEERRELSNREKLRLDRLGCMSTSLYSPRRERALKIYLDSPQSNNNSSSATTASSSTATTTAAGTSTIKSADD